MASKISNARELDALCREQSYEQKISKPRSKSRFAQAQELDVLLRQQSTERNHLLENQKCLPYIFQTIANPTTLSTIASVCKLWQEISNNQYRYLCTRDYGLKMPSSSSSSSSSEGKTSAEGKNSCKDTGTDSCSSFEFLITVKHLQTLTINGNRVISPTPNDCNIQLGDRLVAIDHHLVESIQKYRLPSPLTWNTMDLIHTKSTSIQSTDNWGTKARVLVDIERDQLPSLLSLPVFNQSKTPKENYLNLLSIESSKSLAIKLQKNVMYKSGEVNATSICIAKIEDGTHHIKSTEDSNSNNDTASSHWFGSNQVAMKKQLGWQLQNNESIAEKYVGTTIECWTNSNSKVIENEWIIATTDIIESSSASQNEYGNNGMFFNSPIVSDNIPTNMKITLTSNSVTVGKNNVILRACVKDKEETTETNLIHIAYVFDRHVVYMYRNGQLIGKTIAVPKKDVINLHSSLRSCLLCPINQTSIQVTLMSKYLGTNFSPRLF